MLLSVWSNGKRKGYRMQFSQASDGLRNFLQLSLCGFHGRHNLFGDDSLTSTESVPIE